MPLLHDPDDIRARATDTAAQAQRRVRRMLGLHATWSALFLGEDGRLKPSAIEFFAAIGGDNFIDRSTFDPDPRRHAFNEGRRAAAIEIMEGLKLDHAKLAALTRQMRETDDE